MLQRACTQPRAHTHGKWGSHGKKEQGSPSQWLNQLNVIEQNVRAAFFFFCSNLKLNIFCWHVVCVGSAATDCNLCTKPPRCTTTKSDLLSTDWLPTRLTGFGFGAGCRYVLPGIDSSFSMYVDVATTKPVTNRRTSTISNGCYQPVRGFYRWNNKTVLSHRSEHIAKQNEGLKGDA